MIFGKFLIIIILIITIITISYEQEFNPIPEGNGNLNDIYSHNGEENNLYFIFLNFRHGARAPLFFIDNNTDMLGGKWHMKGELTKLGRKQHYEIGLRNRERYSNFISEEYNPKEVRVYTTNFDRSINSAQSQLLGLYSNISYQDFNYFDINNKNDLENINTIMPPINLFQYNENNNIKESKYERTFHNHFNCPYIREQIHKNWNETNEIINTLVANFNEEYYKILKKEYKNIKNTKRVRQFDRFCDVYIAIYYDEDNNHILKKITKRGKNITKIKDICEDYLYKHFIYVRNDGHAKNNARISQTNTIKKILNWMEARAEKTNNFAAEYSEPKFVLYSGHDSTLFEMQTALKKSFNIEYEFTKFASTQLFELRRYGNVFYIEIYYNDRLKLNITFDEFKNRIGNFLMNDKEIYEICYIKSEDKYRYYKRLFLLFIVIILLISIGWTLIEIYKDKSADMNSHKIIQIA